MNYYSVVLRGCDRCYWHNPLSPSGSLLTSHKDRLPLVFVPVALTPRCLQKTPIQRVGESTLPNAVVLWSLFRSPRAKLMKCVACTNCINWIRKKKHFHVVVYWDLKSYRLTTEFWNNWLDPTSGSKGVTTHEIAICKLTTVETGMLGSKFLPTFLSDWNYSPYTSKVRVILSLYLVMQLSIMSWRHVSVIDLSTTCTNYKIRN